jgi:hypothetical protein
MAPKLYSANSMLSSANLTHSDPKSQKLQPLVHPRKKAHLCQYKWAFLIIAQLSAIKVNFVDLGSGLLPITLVLFC